MIRLTITVPVDSLPGVEVEAAYQDPYRGMDVDLDTSKLSLVFEGEVEGDVDYEEAHEWNRTRPYAHRVKLSKPRLDVERCDPPAPAICQCWNEGQYGRVHREDCPIHDESEPTDAELRGGILHGTEREDEDPYK